VIPLVVSAMTSVEAGIRQVVSYQKLADHKGPNLHWVVNKDVIVQHEGVTMIGLTYKDRGFAKFVGADLSITNPMRLYTWLDELKQLRNNITTQHIIAAQSESDGFRVGGRLNRQKFITKVPQTVTIELPSFNVGSDHIDAISLKIKAEVCCATPVSVEFTTDSITYVRHAMNASKLDPNDDGEAPRKRSKHADRMSTLIGSKGARSIKKKGLLRAVGATFTDEDGRLRLRSIATSSSDIAALQSAFARARAPRAGGHDDDTMSAHVAGADAEAICTDSASEAERVMSPQLEAEAIDVTDAPDASDARNAPDADAHSSNCSASDVPVGHPRMNSAWHHIFK
jgi:hypothetical protein